MARRTKQDQSFTVMLPGWLKEHLQVLQDALKAANRKETVIRALRAYADLLQERRRIHAQIILREEDGTEHHVLVE